jgi:hypothetical protein
VGEGGVFDGFVLDGEAPVVLALTFAPVGHLELFQAVFWAFADPVQVPARDTAAQA